VLYQLLKLCSVDCWIGKDIGGSVRDLFLRYAVVSVVVRSCESIPEVVQLPGCEGRTHGARRFAKMSQDGRTV
jgi:hypothetical protein